MVVVGVVLGGVIVAYKIFGSPFPPISLNASVKNRFLFPFKTKWIFFVEQLSLVYLFSDSSSPSLVAVISGSCI